MVIDPLRFHRSTLRQQSRKKRQPTRWDRPSQDRRSPGLHVKLLTSQDSAAQPATGSWRPAHIQCAHKDSFIHANQQITWLKPKASTSALIAEMLRDRPCQLRQIRHVKSAEPVATSSHTTLQQMSEWRHKRQDDFTLVLCASNVCDVFFH